MAVVAFIAFGAIALVSVLLPAPAAAIDQCMECRAVARFRGCDKPIAGKPAFQGRVSRADAFGCSELLSLEVIRAGEIGLPSRIQVALGACAVWGGKAGDVIDVAVEEPLSLQSGLYTLACRHW
jgi:hypothetical protein